MSGERCLSAPECAWCGAQDNHVVDSRWHELSNGKRRIRHCHACDERFWTSERTGGKVMAIKRKRVVVAVVVQPHATSP